MDVPDETINRFEQAAEEREDDPTEVLKELMISYADGESVSTDGSAQPETVESLDTYNPADHHKISKDALRGLTGRRNGTVAIDPDDVAEVPGSVGAKQSLVVACCRHEYDILQRDELRELANEVIPGGIGGSGYKQRLYVEQTWERLIEHGFDHAKRFTSVEATVRYLEKTAEANHDDWCRKKILQVSEPLVSEYGVPAEEVNQYRLAVDLDPL